MAWRVEGPWGPFGWFVTGERCPQEVRGMDDDGDGDGDGYGGDGTGWSE